MKNKESFSIYTLEEHILFYTYFAVVLSFHTYVIDVVTTAKSVKESA
jgi:hypothetical protein